MGSDNTISIFPDIISSTNLSFGSLRMYEVLGVIKPSAFTKKCKKILALDADDVEFAYHEAIEYI